MTDNAIIATALGWIKGDKGFTRGMWRMPEPDSQLFNALPEYDNDLNAIHEAEAMLTEEEWIAYVDALTELVLPTPAKYPLANTIRNYRHATAAQCAQALAKVLGGRKG